MKVTRAAALALVLMIGPAYAQMPEINLLQEGPGKTADQIETEKQVERAYKETLKKIPDAKAANDPWGSVRSDAAPKAAARPAKTTAAKRAKPVSRTAAGQTN